ncbi:MAG: PAS domain-containing protein [Clostridia bacterium]|nr:PAS domain-containing protein [Clostridia bacterium]
MSLKVKLALAISATLGPLLLATGIYLSRYVPPATWHYLWSAMAFLMAAGTACGYFWARHFTQRLQELLPVAQAAARGDLEQQASIITGDEIGRLAAYFNEIIARWRGSLREISRERDQLDAILTSMSDGVMAVDRAGRVVLVNRAAREMLGVSAADPVGRSVLETVRHYEVDAAVQAVLAQGTRLEKEIRLHPTLPTTYRLSLVPIVGEGGQRTGAVLVLQDVTQVRQLERLRSEFVANVSHELRTPLTSIKGFAETLLEGAAADKGLRQKFLEIIITEANRLHRLIDDLLILSHAENRQFELKRGQADLHQVVAKVEELLLPLAQAKGLALQLDLPPTLPSLPIHEDYLGQILLNLMDNAVKYTPAGGKVTISARVANGELEVAVQDTGIGIPAEALPRLFERFFRVDKARSRELGGTGLGLAIVKHLLERHGGRIRVTSAPGKGTRFVFNLPLPEGGGSLTQS